MKNIKAFYNVKEEIPITKEELLRDFRLYTNKMERLDREFESREPRERTRTSNNAIGKILGNHTKQESLGIGDISPIKKLSSANSRPGSTNKYNRDNSSNKINIFENKQDKHNNVRIKENIERFKNATVANSKSKYQSKEAIYTSNTNANLNTINNYTTENIHKETRDRVPATEAMYEGKGNKDREYEMERNVARVNTRGERNYDRDIVYENERERARDRINERDIDRESESIKYSKSVNESKTSTNFEPVIRSLKQNLDELEVEKTKLEKDIIELRKDLKVLNKDDTTKRIQYLEKEKEEQKKTANHYLHLCSQLAEEVIMLRNQLDKMAHIKKGDGKEQYV